MITPLAAFVRAECSAEATRLVPEIKLHLAHTPHKVFQSTRAFQAEHPDVDAFPPYWAFAWPGGQAMARHILDSSEIVRGLRVADVGAGSGIASIAAVMAGAAHVLAVDVDPLAASAIAINADANDVAATIETTTEDCLAGLPPVDLILISDLVYEPELAVRVGGFVERALAAGVPVVMGDRLSARRPAHGFVEVARYDAPLTPPLCEEDAEQGRIWQRLPQRQRRETRRAARGTIGP
jgi:predicted nicotinamide N-methyase